MVAEKFDDYIAHGNIYFKQTAKSLRRTMLRSFINALQKSLNLDNIENAFKKTGICPLDPQKPLNSQFTHISSIWDPDNVLKNYWLNNPDGLKITEDDYDINLHEIVSNLKSCSIEEGKALSDLPPLFDEMDSISKIKL